MDILVTICARGGSKGIPRKNIKPVVGHPLIAYTIKLAQRFAKQHGADLALSTEDEEIAQIAADYGLSTDYRRPAELAGDTAGRVETIDHLLRHHEQQRGNPYDFVLDMEVVSPLRTLDDLTAGLQLLLENDEALDVIAVSSTSQNPYFNMIEQKEDGFFNFVKVGNNAALSRQSAPPVYIINGAFYVFRRQFFELGIPAQTNDRCLAYVMPHQCFDFDEPEDFIYFEYLVEHGKLAPELAAVLDI